MIAVTGWWSLGICLDSSKSTISVRFIASGPLVKTQSMRLLPFSVFLKLLNVFQPKFTFLAAVSNESTNAPWPVSVS